MTAPISVVVVSYNTAELLADCLDALADDQRSGLAEVVVVDNGSSDGSPIMVRERFDWVKLLEPEENLGFGAAVNWAAALADPRARWIAVANADTAPEPSALRALLEAGDSNPGAGVIAPRLVLPDGSTQHSVHPFPSVWFTALYNLGVQRLSQGIGDGLTLEGYWDPTRRRRVDWAVAAFVLIRRSAFVSVGGFDPAQWMYAEDLDLAYRLDRAGWATRYEPRAVVRHHESAATSQAWGEAVRARWMAATYAWMLRRRGGAITRMVALLNALGALFLHETTWARLHARGLRPRRALDVTNAMDPRRGTQRR